MYQKQAATEKNETLLDVVTIRICEKLETLPRLTNACSIYKVPDRLRLGNEGDYTPKVVSIGPFHHGKEELRTMEEHKYRYLRDFLARGLAAHSLYSSNYTYDSVPDSPDWVPDSLDCIPDSVPKSVSYYVDLIKEKEAELRSAYAESINLGSDEFVSMILVDTAFTIEVLLRLWSSEFRNDHDRIFNKPYMINDIFPDMVLLENQLPLFIIKDLYQKVYPFHGNFPHINELLVRFTSALLDLNVEMGENPSSPIIPRCISVAPRVVQLENTCSSITPICRCVDPRVEHLVDLLRYIYRPPINSRETRKKAIITTPSSVELCQAGVQFKVMKSTKLFKSCIHDDDFKSCIDYIDSLRVLKLTKLTVSRKTEVAVMNLLAFEQCNRIDMTAYANDFVAFLDCLIHSSKDVDLLVKQEIIDNRLADNSCAYTVIKKLGNAAAVSSESFCFASICEDLNQYHNSRRSRLKAALNKWAISLRKNYFYSPWAIISVIAAFILLVLTFIQAVCSIMSV
ncbi:UPF0481 protein At3g47200-like isoform X2 [Ziziphus jujuba]|uniref:UPF0481 protein At3g47200-like isoform X2 n=1 Tax=Ziziphus jujuba TaxID=326968 RepID=A0ABM4A6S3_ZIZJJ|nr:UPF0481 protein At3g47200-like isoform X2 [Ziziphus jujuba]